MTVVLIVVSVGLSLSALMALIRLIKGPSMLDRAVALDVLVAIIVAGLGVNAIATGEIWVLASLLVLSLVAFTGSAAIARFMVYRDDDVEGGR
ncbi:monovalent cation/H+ antiporter complex subunit F [Actinomadura flavalba]|uniref:monovalent cation/H+ antiporter complex subunit F n=1 Tax=Actinomadura flavalba TaxID=1120938 RepID=UPI000382E08C|nr:monovalent cation/H+ antiporter complex subunit F [Actinomadura flavalba]